MKKILILLFCFPLLSFAQNKVKINNYFEDLTIEEERIIVNKGTEIAGTGIYNTSKRKLQPVALNSGLFWQKGLKVIKKGHIIIEFLPHIDIGLDKKEVLNKVENSIESATNKLLN